MIHARVEATRSVNPLMVLGVSAATWIGRSRESWRARHVSDQYCAWGLRAYQWMSGCSCIALEAFELRAD